MRPITSTLLLLYNTHKWWTRAHRKASFMYLLYRPSNAIIPTTPESLPVSCQESVSPSSSGSPLNASSESPSRQSTEWNSDETPTGTPSRENSAPNLAPRNTSQSSQGLRTPPLREQRTPRQSEEQNGNQNENARPDRSGVNVSQQRRPARMNRNRNSALLAGERRAEPQPSDLPRGYGKNHSDSKFTGSIVNCRLREIIFNFMSSKRDFFESVIEGWVENEFFKHIWKNRVLRLENTVSSFRWQRIVHCAPLQDNIIFAFCWHEFNFAQNANEYFSPRYT